MTEPKHTVDIMISTWKNADWLNDCIILYSMMVLYGK